ncbi:hypothetical protein [Herbaspirillum lusitanum]
MSVGLLKALHMLGVVLMVAGLHLPEQVRKQAADGQRLGALTQFQ